MVEPKARETRLSALEALIEIDEHRCASLAIPRDFVAERLRVEEVAVQHKFLSDAVMQHLRHLETAQRCAQLVRNALPDQLDDQVRIGKIERGKLIGPPGVNACRIIIYACPTEP